MALEDLGYETRSYSGRGMYGKSCLGFVVENGDLSKGWVANLIEWAAEHPDEGFIIAGDVAGYRTDSMGLGQIIYFPQVPYISEVVEEWVGDELDATWSTRDVHSW